MLSTSSSMLMPTHNRLHPPDCRLAKVISIRLHRLRYSLIKYLAVTMKLVTLLQTFMQCCRKVFWLNPSHNWRQSVWIQTSLSDCHRSCSDHPVTLLYCNFVAISSQQDSQERKQVRECGNHDVLFISALLQCSFAAGPERACWNVPKGRHNSHIESVGRAPNCVRC